MSDCGICKYYQGKQKCAKGCSIPNDNCAEYEIDKGFIDKTRVIPEGKKYDEGKNRMGLVLQGFANALWEVGRVGTFGANKYSPNSWQNLTNGKERYLDALCRHLFQHLQGKKVDDDSGLLHLSAVCWNALALLEFELKDNIEKIDN